MNDDRLVGLLGSLRTERMDRIADQKIRARLENAWSSRTERRSFGWRARRLGPVLASLVLFGGLSAATMNAAGDSLLYGVRIAVEDAAIALHFNAQDRADYVLWLLEQRQTEAARLEAVGNAAAASKVRAVEQNTLRIVRALVPQAPEDEPAPVAVESPSPTPSDSAAVTPSPVVTPPPASFRPGAPSTTPTQTPTPPPATPTPVRTAPPPPAPTGSPMLVVAYGMVRNPDGTPAAGVCVRLFTTSATCAMTTASDGLYRVSFSGRINQSVTIYLTRQDGTILWKAIVMGTIRGPSLQMADAKLTRY